MPVRPCIRCGCLVEQGSYCQAHAPPSSASRQTPGRGGGRAAARFRAAVLARAGHRCEVFIDGERCRETTRLEAHHLLPIVDGGTDDLSNGLAVCRRHHRQVERLT